jgi:hypothetical protein
MASIAAKVADVKGQSILGQALEEAGRKVEEIVTRHVYAYFDQVVERTVGRAPYVRRQPMDRWLEQHGRCKRCGTRLSQHFRRNGSRPRTLTFLHFTLHLSLPRVVCDCGGSVSIDFSEILRPYQRFSDEVHQQLQRWAQLSLSLRQMQEELSQLHIGALGLRTILTRLHQLCAQVPTITTQNVPPVLQIDAIWLTQLRPNGQVRRDRQGRRRMVKGRFKRPLFIALGVWPEQGRTEIVACQLGQSEDSAAWLAFLTQLEELRLRSENGLQLIIHDGGGGLCSALLTVYYGEAHQRCLFHKIRNIANALHFPEPMTAKQRSRRRKAILKDFRAIWDAKRYLTALRRYLAVFRKYRLSQPQAVATLRRDFRNTLTFYRIQQLFPTWPRRYLRTTSHLERLNRSLRKHARSAAAYHSDAGILAMIARQARHKHPTHSVGQRP